MLLDLFLVSPLIIYSLLGLRDGLVRKVVGVCAVVVGLFLGQAYMRDAGNFLAANAGVSPTSAPSLGFLGIFVFVTLMASLIYKFASDNYKIGGIADKLLGAFLGFVQGALIASTLLLFMAFRGAPSRQVVEESRLYKPIVNLAPQILDLGSEVGSEAAKNIETLTSPQKPKTEKKEK